MFTDGEIIERAGVAELEGEWDGGRCGVSFRWAEMKVMAGCLSGSTIKQWTPRSGI